MCIYVECDLPFIIYLLCVKKLCCCLPLGWKFEDKFEVGWKQTSVQHISTRKHTAVFVGAFSILLVVAKRGKIAKYIPLLFSFFPRQKGFFTHSATGKILRTSKNFGTKNFDDTARGMRKEEKEEEKEDQSCNLHAWMKFQRRVNTELHRQLKS